MFPSNQLFGNIGSQINFFLQSRAISKAKLLLRGQHQPVLWNESGHQIHKDGIGSGLSKNEGSKSDHKRPVADQRPPAG